jgi:hypothetical protein
LKPGARVALQSGRVIIGKLIGKLIGEFIGEIIDGNDCG